MKKVESVRGLIKSQRKKMSQKQFDFIKKYYSNPRNNARLVALIKKAGYYVEFVEDVGYMYAVKVGETEDMDVMLNVSLRGETEIHDGFLQVTPGVEKALNLA